MTSSFIQEQVQRLLQQASEALTVFDWDKVRKSCEAVIALDPNNSDARALLAAEERAQVKSHPPAISFVPQADSAPSPLPSSFANGRYAAKKLLGEGGKKRVYLAHDTKLDRDVAFALIKADGLDEDGRQRVTREAQAMGRLGDHPCLMPIHDTGEEDGLPYLVLPLMPGGDVEGLLEKADDHRLPLERALDIAKQVARGLEFAHSKGIVHRDLKPGNVWLTQDGTVKIGDFGLAVAVDKSRMTQAGMMVGTAAYMAPEQAMGAEVTPQADLYSLGAMLYELVTGRPPFVGDESVAIITQHLNTPPVAPSWHRPDCPPALETLVLRLLEKDPSKRPASAKEVLQALEGIDLSVPVAPAPEAKAAQPTNPIYRRTFVGREAELKQLQAAFDGAVSGQGALAMVVGEPGIGKTSLCEQLATYVAMRGGKTLVGHSYEEGSLSLPYLPFVEAMRSYVLARDPAALKQELGTAATDVARIVSEIRERLDVEPRQAGDPEDDRWRLLQSVSTFLRNAAAVQPLVIVLEDLHWADRGTLDLLLHIARNLQGTRILIVGTYRDIEVDRQHPLSAALGEMRRGVPFGRVLLRGLTPDEVHRMLNALTGQEARWTMAEAIHRQTEGNPLFIQEVMRYLVEEGYIAHEGGKWARTGDEAPEAFIPEGLRDVIGRRLTRLSDECNRVLSIAAVIGRDFDLAVLQKVSGLSEDDLLNALEEADHAAVIEERPRVGANLSYRFTHAFFRQTLYEEIFGGRRVRLHQQVGRALEDIYPRNLKDHASELAEHFGQSSEESDLSKAVLYSRLAAERAMGVFAYSEAVRLLEQALKAQEVLDPEDKEAKCDLLLNLGDALLPAGEPHRVFDAVAEKALSLAETLDDRGRAARACRLAGDAIHHYGGAQLWQTPEWKKWAMRADLYAQPGSIDRVYADVALALAERVTVGKGERAWDLAQRAVSLARDLNESEAFFRAAQLYLMGTAPDTWEIAYRLAGELAEQSTVGVSTWTLGQVLGNVGSMLLAGGDRSRAERTWGRMEEVAKRSNDRFLQLRCIVRQANIEVLDGRLTEAVAAGERSLSLGEELGSAIYGEQARATAAFRPLLYLGRVEEALSIIERLQGESPLRWGRYVVGLAHLGRREEAAAALASGRDMNRSPPRLAWLVNVLESANLLRDVETAASAAEQLAPFAENLQTGGNDLACIPRHLADGAVLQGNVANAVILYQQAIDVCAKVRFRPELALSHLGLAELLLDHYPNEHADAIAHLDTAIAEFRDMKMLPSLERALRRKQTLGA